MSRGYVSASKNANVLTSGAGLIFHMVERNRTLARVSKDVLSISDVVLSSTDGVG